MRAVLLLAIAIAAAAPAAARAQNMAWSTIIPSVTGTDILGTTLRLQMEQADAAQRRGAAQAQAAPSLRYTPSIERRRANLAAFVAKSRAADPAGAESLAQLFASGDIIARIGEALAPQGLRIDDLADAYAVWWITAWQASQGNNDTPSRATTDAVRAQAARAIAGTAGFAAAGDAQRQEMAEALLIQAMLLDAAVEQSKSQPAQLQAVGAAAAQGAKGMGLDLSRMRLTEAGFVPA
jgi:hypothetical protein